MTQDVIDKVREYAFGSLENRSDIIMIRLLTDILQQLKDLESVIRESK